VVGRAINVMISVELVVNDADGTVVIEEGDTAM